MLPVPSCRELSRPVFQSDFFLSFWDYNIITWFPPFLLLLPNSYKHPVQRLRIIPKRGRRDFKSQRMKELSVRSCLLAMSTATIMMCHQHGKSNLRWPRMNQWTCQCGWRQHMKPQPLHQELQEPKECWMREQSSPGKRKILKGSRPLGHIWKPSRPCLKLFINNFSSCFCVLLPWIHIIWMLIFKRICFILSSLFLLCLLLFISLIHFGKMSSNSSSNCSQKFQFSNHTFVFPRTVFYFLN